VRIIVATNRNLAEEVRAKRFREDLFFRLAVVRLRVPPLRERREDIPHLAERFAREAGLRLDPEAIAPLLSYEWPGNVRELKNTVLRMASQSVGPREALLDPSRLLSPDIIDESGAIRPWLDARERVSLAFERSYVSELLLRADGNLTRAAQLAGITRQSFTAMAERHGLRARRGPSDG
jgi:two-component system response regulator AtoC